MSEHTKRVRGDYRLPGQFDNGYKVIPPIYDVPWETIGWGYEWWPLSLNYLVNATMIRRRVEYGEDKRGRVQKVNSYSINPNVDE